MRIKSISLDGIRAFQSKSGTTIPLGHTLTVIAGLNGTGKSTVLAALGNCGRLEKTKATHLNGDQFTTELSEVLKFDVDHDSAGSSVSIEFEDDENGFADNIPPDGVLRFRSSIQKSNSPTTKNGESLDRLQDPRSRLRLIPRIENRPVASEAKLDWPTYYLGLSRLFPVGETDDYSARSKQWGDDILVEYETIYNKILNLDHPIETVKLITSPSARNKKGLGVATSSYGFVSNSAGQDNLGQIILAALSFKRLKYELGDDYHGGILLIDEIEATLHPVAQYRLLDFLYKTAHQNGFQIAITTHSLTILEHFSEQINEYDLTRKLVNLRRTGEDLDVEVNPAYAALEADLNSRFLAGARVQAPKIFLEDSTARMVFGCLRKLKFAELDVEVVEGDLGWTNLLTIANEFPQHLLGSLIVLDPDVRAEPRANVEGKLNKSIFRYPDEATLRPGDRHLLFLPGSEPVEKMLYTFYKQAGSTIDVYRREVLKSFRVNYSSLMNMDRAPTGRSELDRQKWWFENIPDQVKLDLITYWLENADLEIGSFVSSFRSNYEIVKKFV